MAGLILPQRKAALSRRPFDFGRLGGTDLQTSRLDRRGYDGKESTALAGHSYAATRFRLASFTLSETRLSPTARRR
jgi:hypothetical protein